MDLVTPQVEGWRMFEESEDVFIHSTENIVHRLSCWIELTTRRLNTVKLPWCGAMTDCQTGVLRLPPSTYVGGGDSCSWSLKKTSSDVCMIRSHDTYVCHDDKIRMS